MTSNTSAILYHIDEDTDEEKVQRFNKASLHGKCAVNRLYGGRNLSGEFILRIPTEKDIDISCGDKVYVTAICETLTVVGFSDNRCAGRMTRHWKVLLKQ